ncbi:MAG: class I SAM-dependent methyltransferase [Candidatus Omnitrophica bacterium]|nr:class I SAM-dependent methyltransferase [Candidatus Omnitrophota bacterium]
MDNLFDKYYEKYDAWYDKQKLAYLCELKAIGKVLPKKGHGLEIGVGTGRFAQALGITTGIDPSKKMIEIAEKRGINVKLGYGENLSFEDSTFDYVAIIMAICFTRNPQEVLKQAYRVLKKKGKIIIAIVDKDSFLGQFYQRKKSLFYKKASFFNPQELTGLLKNAGFHKFSYYQTLYDFPDEIKSVQDPEKGFGRGGFVVIAGEKK